MSPRIIELPEYETKSFAEDELKEDLIMALHAAYPNQISVEPPSFLNSYCWRLTSQGWVGYIPLTSEVHFSLVPKVPIRNLFGMLEYAYRLKGFRVVEGLVDSGSITELYDRLALILAKRILDRMRKGLYRSYIPESDNLPYVRGRIDVQAYIRSAMPAMLPCHFEEHTGDLEDNQILLWTLSRILSCGICSDRSLPYVRQAGRSLQGFVTAAPFCAEQCFDRLYNRLNQDYEPMHALCRFFLEHTGPTHWMGDRRMLPILVDMERLFELFVVEWLKEHRPEGYEVHEQVNVQLMMGRTISINIDITIEDLNKRCTLLVLDTKYKASEEPAPTDIQQIVAYAAAKNCRRAVLVYPILLRQPIRGPWGHNIQVETLAFRLDGNIEECGKELLTQLIPPQNPE